MPKPAYQTFDTRNHQEKEPNKNWANIKETQVQRLWWDRLYLGEIEITVLKPAALHTFLCFVNVNQSIIVIYYIFEHIVIKISYDNQ